MFVARAPTRLDFGGGWTDVPPYPEERGGFVCNLAIDRYATVSLQAQSAPSREAAPHAEAPSPFVAAALRRGGLPGAGVHLASDFPVGSGLGGSSAAGVALAAAIHAAKRLNSSASALRPHALNDSERSALAEWSRALEVEELGIAGGRQDHYAAAHGGALGLDFGSTTVVEPIPLTAATIARLERQCLLAYTGESRISATTITAVLDSYRDREHRVLHALDRMCTLARDMRDALARGDVSSLGALVNEHWQHQRALHPGISTERIDAIEAAARNAGALGMKALGASGGGCVVVFTDESDDGSVARAISGLATLMPWRVAETGVSVESVG